MLRDKFQDIGEVKFAEMRGTDMGMVRFASEWDAERAVCILLQKIYIFWGSNNKLVLLKEVYPLCNAYYIIEMSYAFHYVNKHLKQSLIKIRFSLMIFTYTAMMNRSRIDGRTIDVRLY